MKLGLDAQVTYWHSLGVYCWRNHRSYIIHSLFLVWMQSNSIFRIYKEQVTRFIYKFWYNFSWLVVMLCNNFDALLNEIYCWIKFLFYINCAGQISHQSSILSHLILMLLSFLNYWSSFFFGIFQNYSQIPKVGYYLFLTFCTLEGKIRMSKYSECI